MEKKRYNFEAEAAAAGCSVETAKEGLMIGEELLQQLSMEAICEPGKRYRKEIDGFSEIVGDLQKGLKAKWGISFTDSGKALIAIGLAAWAADLAVERRHNQN